MEFFGDMVNCDYLIIVDVIVLKKNVLGIIMVLCDDEVLVLFINKIFFYQFGLVDVLLVFCFIGEFLKKLILVGVILQLLELYIGLMLIVEVMIEFVFEQVFVVLCEFGVEVIFKEMVYV